MATSSTSGIISSKSLQNSCQAIDFCLAVDARSPQQTLEHTVAGEGPPMAFSF